MLEPELAAGVAEGVGFIRGAIIGDDAPDGDAKALVIGDRRFEMGDGARAFFIGMDLGEGDARGVIDADVDVLPAVSLLALAPRCGLAGPIARDAMADPFEAAELLDVEVVTCPRIFGPEVA